MSSLSGAKWLFLSNLFQKIFTFSINQIIIRQSNPEIFGIAAIQLELLLSTLLFLSREGIRLALIRTVPGDSIERKQQMINLSWIPSLLIALISCVFYLYCPIDIAGMTREVVLLYCFGALFESFGEPWINIYNNRSELAPRARADAIAVTVRCLVTLLAVVYLNLGVLGFGIAQAAYGISHFLSLLLTSLPPFGTWKSFQSFFFSRPQDTSSKSSSPASSSLDDYFHLPTLVTAIHLTGTSILKHFLTEGDRIILSISVNHYNQGVYGVTYNYGSLVARLLFQPLEESCRISFAQISGTIKQLEQQQQQLQQQQLGQGQNSSKKSEAEEGKLLKRSLETVVYKLLRIIILFGSVFPLFGPFYARLLVKIILGAKWYSEEIILSISGFCFYLFLMGFNGISEAFVQSVAQASLFGAMNQSLFLSSFLFYASAPFLISHYGTVGIIIANCLSMTLRILFNFQFISSYFSQLDPLTSSSPSSAMKIKMVMNSFLQILPTPLEWILSLISLVVLYFSSNIFASSSMTLVDAVYHIARGGLVFVSLVGYHGWVHWKDIQELLRGKRGGRGGGREAGGVAEVTNKNSSSSQSKKKEE